MGSKRFLIGVFASAMLLPALSPAQAPPAPIGPLPNARQTEFYHREREIFFHFNMATFQNVEQAPGTASPNVFNPTALNCEQWMQTIKKAGFTTAVLTAKHTDGFCIWPTAATTYSVKNSAWQNGQGDVVKNFTDACHKYGIKAGIYCSLHDKNVLNGTEETTPNATYIQELRELLSNYGPIWEIWWDGPPPMAWAQINDTVARLQPNCVKFGDLAAGAITDVRWVGNEEGVAGDPCWSTIDSSQVVAENTSVLNTGQVNGAEYYPAEVDVPIRLPDDWFYHPADNASNIRTVAQLWSIYLTSTGRNSVLMLDLPPTTAGLLYPVDSQRIDSLNTWIYGTFLTNLAAGAQATALHGRGAAYSPSLMLDTSESTYYAAADGYTTDTITFTFPIPSTRTFNVVMAQEVIALGERVTGWGVDAYYGSAWHSVVSGEKSIGYKWIDSFPTVTASQVRLRITSGKACPAIHTFGIYLKQSIRPPSVPLKVAFESPGREPEAFTMHILGRVVGLPATFAGKTIAADLIDCRGRIVQRMTSAGNAQQERPSRPGRGVYLLRCRAGNAEAVKVMAFDGR